VWSGSCVHLSWKRVHNQWMTRRFLQVDVFGSAPFLGNPVAVVLDAQDIDDGTMATIARWTNLSETTFVLPPTSDAADYRVRIWTPFGELPFAGHPTLGTCWAWSTNGGISAKPGATVQECTAGLITVRSDGDRLAFAAPPLVRSGPVEPDVLADVIDAMQLDPSTVEDAQWVDNGPGWMAVLLQSADAVRAVRPRRLPTKVGLVGLVGRESEGADAAIEVRAFFPKDGAFAEDPVTGSLNASVGQWLIGSGRLQSPYVASQGSALGRAGRVHVSLDGDGQIWVAGTVRTLVEGSIDV
jgi:PhzF family phenazine biosynthesis protein